MKPADLAEVQNIIRHLATAIANAGLYGLDHPQINRLCTLAQNGFTNLLQSRSRLVLMIVDGVILCDDFPLPTGLHAQKFARFMEQRRIHRMTVTASPTGEDLFNLVAFLLQKTPSAPPACTHLRFETLSDATAQTVNSPEKKTPADTDALRDIKTGSQNRLAEIFEDYSRKRTLKVTGLAEIVTGFIQTFNHEAPSLLTLMPLRAMDEYTFTHGLNVCLLNLAQAMNLGITGELLHDIGIAALLHDIGKLHIPMEILGKPGKLNDREWELMKRHPADGARRLLDCPGVTQLAVIAAFEHHLRYDLSGYPRVNSAWPQHLCSHITTISDVYDALRTKRPYKDARSAQQCAAILVEMAGRELHPQLAANFLYLIDQAASRE